MTDADDPRQGCRLHKAVAMTLRACNSAVVLSAIVMTSVGCSTTDYGPPTPTTMIEIEQSYGGPPVSGEPTIERGVVITGTAAVYTASFTTAEQTIATSDVAAIVHALEHVDFLALDDGYLPCPDGGEDGPGVAIQVALSAGAKSVDYSMACTGGKFDQLATLEQQIFDLSGFTAWLASR